MVVAYPADHSLLDLALLSLAKKAQRRNSETINLSEPKERIVTNNLDQDAQP